MEFKLVPATYRGPHTPDFKYGWTYQMELCEHQDGMSFRFPGMDHPEQTLTRREFREQWIVRRSRPVSRPAPAPPLAKKLFQHVRGLFTSESPAPGKKKPRSGEKPGYQPK
ncbi:hypothetical protein IC235_17950 [Hymenobacter sp. BT664]|uniref:Uncharacterized protein n=1 Tax=Hymenobacter montanus TaxID=2771359 RepID=A0A927BF75_9BACT|nr:hypothetical protein [Hymenobacter montanus]MBD2769776.1 hypothetical protein [Hymenobacter montanus]